MITLIFALAGASQIGALVYVVGGITFPDAVALFAVGALGGVVGWYTINQSARRNTCATSRAVPTDSVASTLR